MQDHSIARELQLRALAQKDLYSFVKLKWERYNQAPFMENWHIQYLCKILESTLPGHSAFTAPLAESAKMAQSRTSSALNRHFFDNHQTSGKILECQESLDLQDTRIAQSLSQTLECQSTGVSESELTHSESQTNTKAKDKPHKAAGFLGDVRKSEFAHTNAQGEVSLDGFGGCAELSAETSHKGSLDSEFAHLKTQSDTKAKYFETILGAVQGEAREHTQAYVTEAEPPHSTKSVQKTSLDKPITRLMINMPPSYGKTEIIARCFIAWALGQDRKRKFFYISYSDDLCRKIANQVRSLVKSPLWTHIFTYPPEFLQDNAQEFVFREGGGLFVTTLKSALTGFHADQILIDDPIKVSEMSSKSAIKAVNQNFKESVLSRLQNNQSNITLLMQRLSQNDLCGFLLDEKEFEEHIIKQWQVVTLRALEKEAKTYAVGDYLYKREAGEALFPQRHSREELELLRLQMGNDEFSAQYLQEPLVSSGGYFDESFYTHIFLHEMSEYHSYIFVDNAMSLKESADNRAIVVVGVENYKQSVRYCMLDCFYGVWSEEQTIAQILECMSAYPKAKVYIESDGGGLVLHRLLLVELAKFNQRAKENGKVGLEDHITLYTPSRKISKVDKIKAMRPFYNTGFLVFSHNARGQEQFKKELFSFNPDKPFRKDDCIDALSSALGHAEVVPPPRVIESESRVPRHRMGRVKRTWRI